MTKHDGFAQWLAVNGYDVAATVLDHDAFTRRRAEYAAEKPTNAGESTVNLAIAGEVQTIPARRGRSSERDAMSARARACEASDIRYVLWTQTGDVITSISGVTAEDLAVLTKLAAKSEKKSRK